MTEKTNNTPPLLKGEATWDSERNCGTYNHNPHHGELLPGTKLPPDGAPDDSLQDLSNSRGTDAAKRSLFGRYKDQNEKH